MSFKRSAGRLLNAVLGRFGCKLVICDRRNGITFAERQLARAVSEMHAVYNRFVFDGDLPMDRETLQLLSQSMYTRFDTGFHLIHCLRRSLPLRGDVCEFGVGQGVISALIAHEIRSTDKNLWLFDSFQGLGKPTKKDILLRDAMNAGSAEAYEGRLSFPASMVRDQLAGVRFPPERTRIIPGFIEKTIHGPDLPGSVCFAYVDFDLYEPILTALEFLDTVLVPGGCVIIDDYGTLFAGAIAAADEFYEKRKEKYTRILPEKTGGNFCIFLRNP